MGKKGICICGTVTKLCSDLSTTYSEQTLELGMCTFTAPPQSSHNATKWASTPLWLGRAGSLFSFAINPDTFAVTPKPLRSHTVCVVSKGPRMITGGTLELGKQAAVVFDGTCSNVRVVGTVIRGGVVVCHGDCSVKFDRVKFEGCNLLVLAGAKAIVRGSQFTAGKPDKVAMCCTGPGSCLKVLQCEVTPGWDIAALCKGPKATMELRECNLTGAIKGTVAVVEGGCGVIRRSALYDCSKAASVKLQGKGSIATLQNCHVEGAASNCVEVIQAGKAVLKDCNLYQARGSAALAHGIGSQLELEHCYLADVRNSCVELVFGAHAILRDCVLQWVTAGPGVRAQGMGATVRLQNCTIQDTQGSSVDTDSFATADLRECRLEKSYEGAGLEVSGKHANAEMNQCCVSDVHSSCVEVSYGAQGRVNGCLLTKSRAGAGVAVRGLAEFPMLVTPKDTQCTTLKGGFVDTKVYLERSILENSAVDGPVAVDGGVIHRVKRVRK